jgi:hypothetical protein
MSGICDDAQQLLRQELALAHREVRDSWINAKVASALLSGALALSGAGSLLLGFMLVKLLQQYWLPQHEWACFGIVGGLFVVLGAVLCRNSFSTMNNVHFVPQQTGQALREDIQAVTHAFSR